MGVLLGVTCEACGYTQELETKNRQYELDEDEWLPVEPALAWCNDCESVQEAEVLPALEDTVARIDALNGGDPQLVAELEAQGRFAEDEVEFQEMILAWLKERESPARCLECEGTDFILFERSEEDDDPTRRKVQHPGCEGKLLLTGLTVRPSGEPLVYSPEGELLE